MPKRTVKLSMRKRNKARLKKVFSLGRETIKAINLKQQHWIIINFIERPTKINNVFGGFLTNLKTPFNLKYYLNLKVVCKQSKG